MNNRSLSRREILKLSGLLPLAHYLPKSTKFNSPSAESDTHNILILVFDALSAYNIPFYGYSRNTTPLLSKLLDKATVYHNHYASSNFTTPGTASLLTGTYPWTHRAFNFDDIVADQLVENNIFRLFPDFHRIAYSHNPLVNTHFDSFFNDIDTYKPIFDLFLEKDTLFNQLFKNDTDIANLSWTRTVDRTLEGYSYSLFLSHYLSPLYEIYRKGRFENAEELFPNGLPYVNWINTFILEDAIDWTSFSLNQISEPFLGYFHYLPPHKPYFTRREFVYSFKDDGYQPVEKPLHPFHQDFSDAEVYKMRRDYDEFILYVDSEINRLYEMLSDTGLLENTTVILTSDHGEMFEHQIHGHTTPILGEPVIKIPLVIFEPGQNTRKDVYAQTNNVDILPTLLHLSGKEIPDWVEGEILPPYKPQNQDRNIYSITARDSEKYGALTTYTAALIKGDYKLSYFYGYPELEEDSPFIEFYNIKDDPFEINNLYSLQNDLAEIYLDEILLKIKKANNNYS